MTGAGIRSKVIMGNFFRRIRGSSLALAFTAATVLFFGALAAAPATAVESGPYTSSVSGFVVGEGNPSTPIEGVSVTLSRFGDGRGSAGYEEYWGDQFPYSEQYFGIRAIKTNTDGTFAAAGLLAGTYKLSVTNTQHRSPWGSLPMSESNDIDELASFVVTEGQRVTGKALTLPLMPTISGTVFGDQGSDDSAAVRLAGAYVSAIDTDGIDTSTTADAEGNYTLSGLDYGSYAVSFQSHGSSSGFAYEREFWNDELTLEASTRIDLVAGSDITGIDATLRAMDPVIAGELTIVGSAFVGETLVASPGAWGPGEITLAYNWWRDGTQFYGNDTTYVVTNDDVGHTISLGIWGTKLGYSGMTATVTTALVTAAESTATPTPTPTATPTPTEAPVATPDETPDVSETSAPASVVGAQSDRVTMPTETLVAGASIPITGEGFAPFEVVDVWLHSTPVLLGTLTADAQGRISGSFPMPASLPTGTHHIVMVDEAGVSYTSAPVVVTDTKIAPTSTIASTSTSTSTSASESASASAESGTSTGGSTEASLAETGADLSAGWIALALLVLGGMALMVNMRRRTASALNAMSALK